MILTLIHTNNLTRNIQNRWKNFVKSKIWTLSFRRKKCYLASWNIIDHFFQCMPNHHSNLNHNLFVYLFLYIQIYFYTKSSLVFSSLRPKKSSSNIRSLIFSIFSFWFQENRQSSTSLLNFVTTLLNSLNASHLSSLWMAWWRSFKVPYLISYIFLISSFLRMSVRDSPPCYGFIHSKNLV